MKRVLCLVTLGMVAVASSGCSLSWPSCFRGIGGFGMLAPEVYECDPCTSYYPGGEGEEWIVEPAPSAIEVLPGPALRGSRAG